MSAVFELVEKPIIEIEGGYVKDIDDPGGETKYGISKREYPNLDIANLTLDQAYVIYKRDYWDKYNVGALKTQELANKLMLGVINMGDKAAVCCLQRAIYRCGLYTDVDGVFGAMTVTGANTAPQLWLLDRLRIEYGNYYLRIVYRKKEMIKYLDGWMRRALL